MKGKIVTDLLKKTGVIMEGHFLLTSGRHSATFLQCSQLLQYPEHSATICRLMAEPFQNMPVDSVIGPAMGGIIPAYEVARILGTRALYAEPAGSKMILRRGFILEAGERVLVAEDAVSTGGSVQKVIDLLKECRAEAVGVTVMIDRTGGNLNLGLPTAALLQMAIESFDAQDCPLCRAGLPLQKPKGAPKK